MGPHRLLALLLLTGLGACHVAKPTSDAVARVNGEAITRQAFDELVERNLRRYSGETQALPQSIRSRIEEGVLKRMVDDLMVEQRCRAEHIEVTEAELEQHFAEHKKRFRSPQAFADYLARSDTSEDALKDDLRKSLLRDRLVDKLIGEVTIGDEEVETYYRGNAGQFTELQKMHVRRLLLRTPQDASARTLAAIARSARKLADTARAHPHAFAALCSKHTEGPEKPQGGSMGMVTTGRMPELDKLMAHGLVEGAISAVTQTAQGLEIYQVSDVTPEHLRPLTAEAQAIRDALYMRKRNDRRQEVLRSLKEAAKVDLLIALTPPQPGAASPAAGPSAQAPKPVGLPTPAQGTP